MSDPNTYEQPAATPPPAPATATAPGADAQAAIDEEGEAFLDKLEAEAEEMMYAYMSARVPMSLRKAFDERHPAPEPQPPAEPPAS